VSRAFDQFRRQLLSTRADHDFEHQTWFTRHWDVRPMLADFIKVGLLLVRMFSAGETLSFSKELETLNASSVWEDAVHNLTREVKTLRVEVEEAERRFQLRAPAMAAGLTDHIWSIKELLWTVVPPSKSTRDG